MLWSRLRLVASILGLGAVAAGSIALSVRKLRRRVRRRIRTLSEFLQRIPRDVVGDVPHLPDSARAQVKRQNEGEAKARRVIARD